MRIMIIADSHSVNAEQIEHIRSMKKDSCKALVFLGDIQRPLIDIFCSHFQTQQKIGVVGNHDSFKILDGSGVINVHRTIQMVDDISFFGFEGSLRYKKTNYPLYTQAEATEAFKSIDQVDVLITHTSPYGINEREERENEGFIGVANYLYSKNPVYHLHGHQHLNKVTVLENKTTVIGVYGVIILDLFTGEIEHLIEWD